MSRKLKLGHTESIEYTYHFLFVFNLTSENYRHKNNYKYYSYRQYHTGHGSKLFKLIIWSLYSVIYIRRGIRRCLIFLVKIFPYLLLVILVKHHRVISFSLTCFSGYAVIGITAYQADTELGGYAKCIIYIF